ncbi:hypothetical protein QTP88_019776 [Uroleucon formosanum]
MNKIRNRMGQETLQSCMKISTEGPSELDEDTVNEVIDLMLNDDRKSLNQKIPLGLATKEELLKQIKVELNMLDTCQLKIYQEMKENDTEYISIEILTILSNRINDMYNCMFLLFPVERTSLSEYIKFCYKNVSQQNTN